MDERLIEAIVEQVAQRLLAGGGTSGGAPAAKESAGVSVTEDIRAGRVVVNISARHVHLTDEHVEALFGAGAKLTPMKSLRQTGEFASEQQVVIVGSMGKTLGPVRVLGPTRKASQVEVSLTDCYALGFKNPPPIRPSGDHRGTFGITMVGPPGAVTLKNGLIRANRHIHLHTSQGEAMGLKNNDLVDVRIDGERPSVFLGCQARVHDMFLAEMHVDTDDGNAVGIKSGATAQLLFIDAALKLTGMRLEYLTAGESHGPQLTAIIRGIPAGLSITPEDLALDMQRRQRGYGRGPRMNIEKDTALIRGGVRKGTTLGSPISLTVQNSDYKNWEALMAPEPGETPQQKLVTRPRPGHADLVGAVKFNHADARNILERSSARETAARVAVGAICRRFLAEFGITLYSHVVNLGGITVDATGLTHDEVRSRAENSELRVARQEVEDQMRALIDRAKKEGDTVGGIYEVVVLGVPLGLGSTMNWDEKIDGRIAQGILSCQAIKGVSIGMGFDVAATPGSKVHDPIGFSEGLAGGGTHKPMVPQVDDEPGSPEHHPGSKPLQKRAAVDVPPAPGRGQSGGFYHLSNNAGGIEGGMTNGEPLIIRGAMKPIATLMKPLQSVDLQTKETFDAVRERSDVCAVPAAGVVGEAIVAFILAQAFLEKFGGDSMIEVRRNYDGYVQYMREY